MKRNRGITCCFSDAKKPRAGSCMCRNEACRKRERWMRPYVHGEESEEERTLLQTCHFQWRQRKGSISTASSTLLQELCILLKFSGVCWRPLWPFWLVLSSRFSGALSAPKTVPAPKDSWLFPAFLQGKALTGPRTKLFSRDLVPAAASCQGTLSGIPRRQKQ